MLAGAKPLVINTSCGNTRSIPGMFLGFESEGDEDCCCVLVHAQHGLLIDMTSPTHHFAVCWLAALAVQGGTYWSTLRTPLDMPLYTTENSIGFRTMKNSKE